MSGKIFIALIIFSMFLPFLAGAITPGTIPGAKELGTEKSPVETPKQLLNAIASVVGWVYTVFFIVAVFFILIAAFNYLTGGDQPEKIKLVHTQLIYAVIAIAIALLAVGATAIIKDVLKGKGGGSQVEIQTPAGPVVPYPVPSTPPPGSPY